MIFQNHKVDEKENYDHILIFWPQILCCDWKLKVVDKFSCINGTNKKKDDL
jgi:hypothetical protein